MITLSRKFTFVIIDLGVGFLVLFVILFAAADFNDLLIREEKKRLDRQAMSPGPRVASKPTVRSRPLREVPASGVGTPFSEMANLRRENAALANRIKEKNREVQKLLNQNINLLNENSALTGRFMAADRETEQLRQQLKEHEQSAGDPVTTATVAPAPGDVSPAPETGPAPAPPVTVAEPEPPVVAREPEMMETPPPPAIIVEEPPEPETRPTGTPAPPAVPEPPPSVAVIPPAPEPAVQAREEEPRPTPLPTPPPRLKPVFTWPNPAPRPVRDQRTPEPAARETTADPATAAAAPVTFVRPMRALSALRNALRDADIPVRIDRNRHTLYLPGILDFERDSDRFTEERKAGIGRLVSVLARVLPCYARGGDTEATGACPESNPDGELDAIVIAGHSGQGPVGSRRFRASWQLATQRALRTLTTLMHFRPELKRYRNQRGQSLFRIDGYLAPDARGEKNPRRVELRFILVDPREAPFPG